MLKLLDVKKSYGEQKVLKGIDYQFGDTGFYALIGASGCGKTTLLNILMCNDTATSGEICYNGINYRERKKMEQVALDEFTYIYQDYKLIENLTVKENLDITAQLFLDKSVDRNFEIENLLNKINLTDKLNEKVYNLSGGEKQRVAIARSLIKRPKVLFADEPTGNLDLENSLEIFKLLKEISKSCLIIVVSHNRELAQEFADTIIKINYGEFEITNKAEYSNQEQQTTITELPKTKKRTLSLKTVFKLSKWNIRSKLSKMFSFSIVFVIFFAISFSLLGFTNMKSMQSNILASNPQKVLYIDIPPYYSFSNTPNLDKINTDKFEKSLQDLNLEKSKVYTFKCNLIPHSIRPDVEIANFSNVYNNLAHTSDFNFKLINIDNPNKIDTTLLVGGMPNDFNEIVISSLFANQIVQYKNFIRLDDGAATTINDWKEVIGKNIVYNKFNKDYMLKVVGVYDSKLDKYNKFLNVTNKNYATLSKNKKENYDKFKQDIITYSHNPLIISSQAFIDATESLKYFDSARDIGARQTQSIYLNSDESMSFNSIARYDENSSYFLGNYNLTGNKIAINTSQALNYGIGLGDTINISFKRTATYSENIWASPYTAILENYEKQFEVVAISDSVPSIVFSNETYDEITANFPLYHDEHQYLIGFKNAKGGVKSAYNKLIKSLYNDNPYHPTYNEGKDYESLSTGNYVNFKTYTPFDNLTNDLTYQISGFALYIRLGGVAFCLLIMLFLLYGIVGLNIQSSNKNILILRSQGVRYIDILKIFFLQTSYLILIGLIASVVIAIVILGATNLFAITLAGYKTTLFLLEISEILTFFFLLLIFGCFVVVLKTYKHFRNGLKGSFEKLER